MHRRLREAVYVGLASVLLAGPAWAVRPGVVLDAAETANVTTTQGRTSVKSVRGAYVFSISLLCTTAPCEVALYDSVADGATNDNVGTLKWEGRVSTNNGTYIQDFARPIVTTAGLEVQVSGTGGSAFVSYQ